MASFYFILIFNFDLIVNSNYLNKRLCQNCTISLRHITLIKFSAIFSCVIF